MDFGKASAGQHRKKNETSSFFKEARIAYLNIQGSTLESLQRDLEAMEAQLESEKDLFVRAEIKGEIDETRDKIRNLSNIEVPLNALLLQGMKLNIDEIDDLLKQEKVISIRNKLAQKRENCVIALNKRVSEVTNLTELDKALDQMQIDETLENKLASGSIDQVTLDLILSSDMKHFMNEAFIGEVESARDKMTAEDNRILKHEEQAILEDIQDKTDKEWSKLKGETQMEIEKLTAEKQSLQSQVGKAKLSDRNRIRKRIREIDRLIERFQAEMEEGRLQFSRKHFTKNETSSARRVGHLADAGTLSKLRTLASEAKLLKLSKIKQYMDSEFDSLEAELESGEREAILGKEVMAKLRAEIRKGKEFLLSKNEVSPSDLKTIGLNLKEAEGLLSLTEKEIATLKKNRPAVEGEVMTAYGKLKAGIETVDPDQMRKVISLRQEELRKQGFKEDSKILSTVEASLTQLTDPSGELRVRLRKYDEALKDIGSLEPSELILLQEELKQMAPQIEMLSNLDEFIVKALSEENQAAQMAHSAIKDLDLVENNKELKEALLDNLGPDHLEFVPKSEFETKYRRYTESGHMVFYQKGDQWKIILDESALESESLEVLKKQLKHELLHLEFEKGQGVKEQVRRMLVEADPKRWEKVRAAFIAMAKEGKKSPPNGKEWKDDDILSELYAMQHEIGRVWSKGDTAVDELNNLLVGLDVKSNIGNMEEMIRGYEGGVKLEDDPEALTKAATETKELSKSQATYEKNKADIGKLSDRIKSLQGSDVVGYVDGAGPLLGKMSSFNDESAHLNEDLLKHPDNAVIVVSISARNTQLDKDLKTVEAEISRAAKDLPNQEMGVLGKVWIDTTFFSLADVVQLGKDVYEFFARRHERKKKDHAARLGKAFFNGTDLGREASARQEKAEAEEVQEWQSRYENKDAWELLDELKNLGNSLLPSKDQLKAILRILAQKGRIE
ncbi:MAG: hypothetical protein OEY44_02185, partial [Candidatus Peregrinibacteria bacterium]|nr:hypothetical protein [Candidatus Peregrinibacteria bacterium]